jgi:hypothetical protein
MCWPPDLPDAALDHEQLVDWMLFVFVQGLDQGLPRVERPSGRRRLVGDHARAGAPFCLCLETIRGMNVKSRLSFARQDISTL